ncbi:helix-turn-helix transcriptional regulator [Metabacillus arenae]|uniref:Helix-turn-helix domain-containing protein n=1 Tax=Metabacillus arenae TaxID=2771434 RepID=A0A926NN40_9BACI|nr:helix-turn-helix domain-containing protein [Metabacillus arenae]MBD1380856.1 helix-turn-helix domain-containing protein [Metabacillus arenae]
MNKQDLVMQLSEKLKLIRTEFHYTQDEMASILGVSKKTLVQIEKGRQEANWPTSVTICALFRDSQIVQQLTGGDPLEVLQLFAHQKLQSRKEKTLGGKVWWRNLKEVSSYRLQQNLISQHFRILDSRDYRIYSSFQFEEIEKKFLELTCE